MSEIERAIAAFLTPERLPLLPALIAEAKGDDLRASWTAYLLCLNSRRGVQGVLKKQSEIIAFVGKKHAAAFAECCSIVKARVESIKTSLLDRGKNDRVQMQRTIQGRSMLALLVPHNPDFRATLESILARILHPDSGAFQKRSTSEDSLKTFRKVPYTLPKQLQDAIPILTEEEEASRLDVSRDAPKMNFLIKTIMDERQRLKLEGWGVPHGYFDDERSRVRYWVAKNPEMELPDEPYQQALHGCKIVVPHATPNDLLVWDSWHASAGSKTDAVKITSFLDYVPTTFLTEPQKLDYEYILRNAPVDVGAGSGRGGWNSFAWMLHRGVRPFGIPADLKVCSDPIMQTRPRGEQERIGFEYGNSMMAKGFAVIPLPPALTDLYPPARVFQQLDSFFQTLSGHALSDQKTMEGIQSRKNAERIFGEPYTFYSRGMPTTQPNSTGAALHPGSVGDLSHNPQAGGILIPQDSGLGPGTSLFSNPVHVGLQTDPIMYDIVRGLYQAIGQRSECKWSPTDGLMLVPERFRLKLNQAWAGNLHVDTSMACELKRIEEVDDEEVTASGCMHKRQKYEEVRLPSVNNR